MRVVVWRVQSMFLESGIWIRPFLDGDDVGRRGFATGGGDRWIGEERGAAETKMGREVLLWRR
jgi:hypothetical protein